MKYALVFLAAGATAAWYAARARHWIITALLTWCGISSLGVSLVYAMSWHQLFGKRSDGTVALPSRLFFAPYLAMTYLTWQIATTLSLEPAWHQKNDNLIIDRRPRKKISNEIVAVLDPRRRSARTQGFSSASVGVAWPSVVDLES